MKFAMLAPGDLVVPTNSYPMIEKNPWEDYESIPQNWKQGSLGIVLETKTGRMGEEWVRIHNSSGQSGWICSKFVKIL